MLGTAVHLIYILNVISYLKEKRLIILTRQAMYNVIFKRFRVNLCRGKAINEI